MLQRLKILVVDDNRDSTDSLVTLLRMTDHTVVGCYSGAEAVARFRDFRPDLVLMDLAMPSMNGCEAALQMREFLLREEGMPPVPIIAVTGFADHQHRQLATSAPFDHYLVKPVEFNELFATIRRMHREAQKDRPLASLAD